METELCCIKGCDLPVVALGLCVNHWRMNVKHGSPVAKRPLSAINRGLGDEQRFWKSVHKTAGCWHWIAGRDYDGYGIFAGEIAGIKFRRAHKFSYTLATGEIVPPSMVLMHTCDNPPCVNPDHLIPGTHAQNTADMVRKGRHHAGQKVRITKIAKLSEDAVRAILRDGRPYLKIAADHGIHPQSVYAIKARIERTEVEIDPAEIVRNKRGARGAAKSKNLTDADVQAIRVSDERTGVLARRYGVSPPTICDIRKLRSWKHLPPPEYPQPETPDLFDPAALEAQKRPKVRNAVCSVDGCDKPVHAHGYCQRHYVRVWRGGEAGPAARIHGGPSGATHHKAALTEDQVREIKHSAEPGIVLSAKYGVTATVISAIRTGRTWKHVT